MRVFSDNAYLLKKANIIIFSLSFLTSVVKILSFYSVFVEFTRAQHWIAANLTFERDIDVQLFEIVIEEQMIVIVLHKLLSVLTFEYCLRPRETALYETDRPMVGFIKHSRFWS